MQDALARLIVDIDTTSQRMLLTTDVDPKTKAAVAALDGLFKTWEASVKSLHPQPEYALRNLSLEATRAYQSAKVLIPRLVLLYPNF